MQPVTERGREERRVAARRACSEQRRAARARGRLGVRDGRRQGTAGALRRGALLRDHRHRCERQALGDPRDLPVPREGKPSQQGRREVVSVRLEGQPGREQLLGARVRRSRDKAERDRSGRRAEPALERNPVDEREPLARGIGEQRVRADGEVRAVGGELRGALALHDDALPVGHLELVPEVERHGGRVEARPDVGRGRGSPESHARAAAAMASGSASTCTSFGA